MGSDKWSYNYKSPICVISMVTLLITLRLMDKILHDP